MRTLPKLPVQKPTAQRSRLLVKLKIVTPMFGGGVEAGQRDEHTPFRGPSVRGQLRFWWRESLPTPLRTRGHAFVRNLEEAIWGSTRFPSPVQIRAIRREKVDPRKTTDQGVCGFDRSSPEAYALFPARPADGSPVRDATKEGTSFELEVTWPGAAELVTLRRRLAEQRGVKRPALAALDPSEYPEDLGPHVVLALRAWVAYGGIGARTRRGCGALELEGVAENANVGEELLKSLSERALPALPGARLLWRAPEKATGPMAAWNAVLSAFRGFRQTGDSVRGPGHDKTTCKYDKKDRKFVVKPLKDVRGQSNWPEADSIRKITKAWLKKTGKPREPAAAMYEPNDHPPTRIPGGSSCAFPRAALGLPIVFHFADGPLHSVPDADRDPADRILVPRQDGEARERMASPVITRPIFDPGTKRWYRGMLFLARPDIATRLEAQLQHSIGKKVIKDKEIGQGEIVNASVPLGPLMRKKASAIEALMDYVENEEHFQPKSIAGGAL